MLFGEKLILQDDFFGKIESNKTRSEKAKSLTWYITKRIPDSEIDTEIIAEGNYLGIAPYQKSILIDFITNFENHYSHILTKLIKANKKFSELVNQEQKYNISVIHPSLINPSPSFEVFFQLNQSTKYSFMVELINKELENLELVEY